MLMGWFLSHLFSEGVSGIANPTPPAWWLCHEVPVRLVEAQCCSRQAISHQVDPQQLHWCKHLCMTHGTNGCSNSETIWHVIGAALIQVGTTGKPRHAHTPAAADSKVAQR